jgi:hypothetical protein
MKKNIFKYALILATLVLFSYCTDLEHEEYGKISSDIFPVTQNDLQTAAIGVYNTLGDSYIMHNIDHAGVILNTVCTDEMNTAWTGTWIIIDQLTWTANNNSASTCYSRYMRAVTKATRIIDAFDKSSVDEGTKAKYIAELRVLRAFYAYSLYALFGPLPIVTDPAIANDVYVEYNPSRPTDEDYINFLVAELKEAAPVLNNKSLDSNWGRTDKGTALTLLLKVYLHAKRWSEANQTADEIIGMNTYDLLDSYPDVFNIKNEGSGNKEAIFVIQRIMSNLSYSWTYFACVMPQSPEYKTESGVVLTVWGGLKMPWDYYDKYEAGDERLKTVIRYYVDRITGDSVDFRKETNARAIGAIPMKFSEDPEHAGSEQGNDFIVFRYADVLLSKAEAMNELEGPTAASVELVNKIRRRAKTSELTLGDANSNSKERLRDFILDERGRELYSEGWRRIDLVRHGKFVQKAIEAGWANPGDNHLVLYPIPQSAINENPNIKQNAGYEQ